MSSLTFANPKDPKDRAPYSFDWSEHTTNRELDAPDPLEEVVFSVLGEPTNPPLEALGSSIIGDFAVVMIGGGVLGQKYVVECTATFESGKVLNRSAKLSVKDL